MSDNPAPETAANKLLEALKDPEFQDRLLDALGGELGDDRDAKIDAVLKSKGLEHMSEEEILSILNPPSKPGPKLDPKTSPPTPQPFDFTLYLGKYTITSASHPDGVYEMWVADGTITVGERDTEQMKGKTFTATPELDKDSKKWWVTWGDKAQDWFSIQFFSSVPADSKDKSAVVTFKGTWHTKEAGKAVEKAFEGKWVLMTRKDISAETAELYKWIGFGIGGTLVLATIALSLYIRRRRAAAADPAWREAALLEVANRSRLGENVQRHQELRAESLANEYYRKLPEAQIQDFETRLTERMREVVENYYSQPGNDALRQEQEGQPEDPAVHNKINEVISERVQALVNATHAQITESLNTSWLKGLSDDHKTELLEAVKTKVKERATAAMTKRDDAGRYGEPAGVAFDRVTKLDFVERTKTNADLAMHRTVELVRSQNENNGNAFSKLIALTESLQKAGRENQAREEIARQTGLVELEVKRLNQDVGNVRQADLQSMQERLERQGQAMEKVKEAKDALERKEREIRERARAKEVIRNLGHPV